MKEALKGVDVSGVESWVLGSQSGVELTLSYTFKYDKCISTDGSCNEKKQIGLPTKSVKLYVVPNGVTVDSSVKLPDAQKVEDKNSENTDQDIVDEDDTQEWE